MERATEDANRGALAEVFSYRAEWLSEKIFALFTEPSYFPQLTSSYPCFLVGGRGTGKTTTLRCLSYEGQAALRRKQELGVATWPYFGMYYRVNTNRVRAFGGPEPRGTTWARIFGHYMNLEFCELVLRFLGWYEQNDPQAEVLGSASVERVAAALSVKGASDLQQLRRRVDLSKLKFEAAINNVDEGELPRLTLQGAPIDVLMEETKKLRQFAAKNFFFLVDEYENLEAEQQRVVNTLIKHCGELYSFKIGVRELGLRDRATLNVGEQLGHPADYKLINITDELGGGDFARFAGEVCRSRLQRVVGASETVPGLDRVLPGLTAEAEAKLLGVGRAVTRALRESEADDITARRFREWGATVEPLEAYALVSRARAEGLPLGEKLERVSRDPEQWNAQYGNYKHAYLFTIRRGKRGIRKHYAGWQVVCRLAAANIRYLLELVEQMLKRQVDGGGPLIGPVPAEVQTLAAQFVGRARLRQLEGVALSGAKLTRLLLGLGRVFQVMAEDAIGHTPEVSQFCLMSRVSDRATREKVETLLDDGIAHLALLRYSGSKLKRNESRDFDYVVHPIFSPFFGFSHRRKRKIRLSEKELWGLVERPTETIGAITERRDRRSDEELPEQVGLFGIFYGTRH